MAKGGFSPAEQQTWICAGKEKGLPGQHALTLRQAIDIKAKILCFVCILGVHKEINTNQNAYRRHPIPVQVDYTISFFGEIFNLLKKKDCPLIFLVFIHSIISHTNFQRSDAYGILPRASYSYTCGKLLSCFDERPEGMTRCLSFLFPIAYEYNRCSAQVWVNLVGLL